MSIWPTSQPSSDAVVCPLEEWGAKLGSQLRAVGVSGSVKPAVGGAVCDDRAVVTAVHNAVDVGRVVEPAGRDALVVGEPRWAPCRRAELSPSGMPSIVDFVGTDEPSAVVGTVRVAVERAVHPQGEPLSVRLAVNLAVVEAVGVSLGRALSERCAQLGPKRVTVDLVGAVEPVLDRTVHDDPAVVAAVGGAVILGRAVLGARIERGGGAGFGI